MALDKNRRSDFRLGVGGPNHQCLADSAASVGSHGSAFFGYSVGDFLAVLKLANQIRKQFVQAPQQFQAISIELRSLTIVLQDAEVRSDTLSQEQAKRLCVVLGNCKALLSELETTLNKYTDLEKPIKGRALKRFWKRLQWEPDDIRDLRCRITAQISILNTFEVQVIANSVAKLSIRQESDTNSAMLEWISPVDYISQHNDYEARGEPRSRKWLFESSEYTQWVNKKGGILLCPGTPGSGKTITTAMITKDIQTMIGNDKDRRVVNVYCTYCISVAIRRPTNFFAASSVPLWNVAPVLPWKSRKRSRQGKRTTTIEIRASDQDVRLYLSRNLSQFPSSGMFLLAELHLKCLRSKTTRKALRVSLQSLATGSTAYDKAYEKAINMIESQSHDWKRLAMQAVLIIACARRPLAVEELTYALSLDDDSDTIDVDNVPDINDVVTACSGLITVDVERRVVRLMHKSTREYIDARKASLFPDADTIMAITCSRYLNLVAASTDSPGATDAPLPFTHAKTAVPKLSSLATASPSDIMPSTASSIEAASNLGLIQMVRGLPDIKSKLIEACRHGNCGMVDLILRVHNYDLNSAPNYLGAPSTDKGPMPANDWKRSYRVDLKLYDNVEDVVLLTIATASGDIPMIELLLASGAELLKQLTNNGLDVDYGGPHNYTPLMAAIAKGDIDATKVLLSRADITKQHGPTGYYPIHFAVTLPSPALIPVLLAVDGIEPNVLDEKGRSAFRLAAKLGHSEVMEELGKDPRVQLHLPCAEGRTAYDMIIRPPIGDEGVFRAMLSLDPVHVHADVTSPELSLLHRACSVLPIMNLEHGNVGAWDFEELRSEEADVARLVTAMLDLPTIDVNLRDREGNTPLTLVIRSCQVDTGIPFVNGLVPF
ncbi:hypothetical protein SAPIO_CDS7403 [Scedosporium apiospermum]|uniref:Uncharacterized protein n=1 Tax=Pseudallescheria apiosperma TaxID=563466 RepID=A0A084G1U1_PSEDA|nr:uncharacterized protein SAPIO_CDS7403 [Scedosporium apiospermum]KEZ41303.1 hypothetical protein SAPIO_CDS7403 [Scedosporium apiospermum]